MHRNRKNEFYEKKAALAASQGHFSTAQVYATLALVDEIAKWREEERKAFDSINELLDWLRSE